MCQVQRIAALAFVACLLPASAIAQARATEANPKKAARTSSAATSRTKSCDVDGVWELVSTNAAGQDQPLNGFRQRKIVSRGHFMWLGAAAKRDTIALHTLVDTLRSNQVSGGTGTYTLAGNTYTEHLDVFVAPALEGQSWPATCRTAGDRWYHTYPPDSARKTTEEWRRIR